MKSGLIYMAINVTNHKAYIGQTINLKNRISGHKSSSKTKDTKFYRAIRKYGWQNFIWIIIQSDVPTDDLNINETKYISIYNTYENGYNETLGGDHNPMSYDHIKSKIIGRRHSAESKSKMSMACKGRKVSKEHRKKISENSTRNPNFGMKGKRHSESSKRKIGLSNRKHYMYEITDPHGNKFTTNDLRSVCKKLGFNINSVYNSITLGKTYKKYKIINLSVSLPLDKKP